MIKKTNNYSLRIFTCYHSLLEAAKQHLIEQSHHENSVLQIFKKENTAVEYWPFLPSHYHKSFWNLFQSFGLLYPISSHQFFIPSLLPNTEIPFDFPPHWNDEDPETPELAYYVARCFLFTSMNHIQFCKLVAALHGLTCNQNTRSSSSCHDRLVLKNIFLNLIQLELYSIPNDHLIGMCKITYDYERSCVTLFVCEAEENNKTFFCRMADELEQIFSQDESFKRASPSTYVGFTFSFEF